MECNKIIEILKELPNKSNSFSIYNEKIIKDIYEEMKQMFQANENEAAESFIEDNINSLATLLIRHACLERNRKGLINYHYHRLMYVKCNRWIFGAILPQEIKQNTSAIENRWFIKYNNIVNKFLIKSGYHELGFQMIYTKKPPKSIYIQVRCLKDYFDYETENGELLNFIKNSQLYLPKSQCEHLIQGGILEHILT